MKKLIYCALALAAGLFATSCQQENLEPVAGGNTVTYTVELPGVDTKAIGDGQNINQLVYEVWRTENPNDVTLEHGAKTELLYRVADKPMANGSTIIELDLVNDQNYTILFWAQVRDGGYYNTDDLRNVTLTNKSSNAFEENRAAFYGVDFIKATDQRKVKQTVALTRPFGQVNLGTAFRTEAQQAVYTLNVDNTSVTVKGASTVFNVATGAASAETEDCTDLEFSAYTYVTNSENLIVKNETTEIPYQWISMNYVFVPANQATFEVDYTIETNHGVVTNTISNIPAKKNYRTNIVGNLLTSKTEYTVNLDTRWDGADFNTTVIEEGIVKNANGDYEVSTPHGLAYMLNNLFKEDHVLAEGGNFYLTAAEYDMTDMIVKSPSVPASMTLNIYGETPVVTRSTTGFAGITIKGLTQPLIGTVSGEVSVSGLNIPQAENTVSVLIAEIAPEAAVVLSEVEVKTVAQTGANYVVAADDVKDKDSLIAALASDVKVIEITADIEAPKVIMLDRSVVINGNGKTFTTSDTRAFRLIASDIEVTFNNLNIVSEKVRTGTTDIRGVSIDGTSASGETLKNISLTLNNCSHNFTDPSAHDWAYAVNVVGGTGYKVTINGGEYKGANVVNSWGSNHTFVIDGAVLTSLYQPSSAYYGFCVSLQEAENSIATIKNSTLNSVHAKAFGGTTENEFVLENNEDNTQVYPFFIGNAPYLTLNEAFAAAENNTTIYAPFNAEISSSTVPAGKKVTLVLQNQSTKYNTQLTGTDESTGSFALINVNPGADLTISGPGSIKLSATNDREWNAYSSVVSNQRGTLTVNEGAIIEHLGGTAMAYGIDNLTNGKGTSAITTINKATVKSPYRAIRQFLNGVEATNELYVNAEAVIEGANKSIWMQDPSTNANTGKLVVAEGAKLYGDVYLFVCAGSESWPVSASIPASTLMDGSEVMTGNVPEGYSVEEKNGVYEVTYKSPAQARLEALINEGGEVVLTENIELSSPIEIKNVTVTLDLNGKTITAGKDGYAIENKGKLTIKNNGVINGVVYAEGTEGAAVETIIDGGTYNALENAKYVFLNSQGASLTINDATINGGSSYPIYSYDADSKLVINDATVNATFGCINAYGTNGKVEINGGTFQMTGVQGKTSHIAYFSNVDAVINGGTFEKVGDINMSGTGGGGICAIYGAALKITKGTFAGDYADLYDWGGKNANNREVAISVEGGTYNFKPTFLAEGCAATQNADGTWTVAKK